jgi:hypothetical protein
MPSATHACFEASQMGRLLPSNVALEFSASRAPSPSGGAGCGDEAEQKHALYGLIEKYFPKMKPGEHYARSPNRS